MMPQLVFSPVVPAHRPSVLWYWSDFEFAAKAAANVYSQFGEDGILAALLDTYGAGGHYVADIGAGDGVYMSNSRALIERGWSGLLVDSNPQACRRARALSPANVEVLQAKVDATGPQRLDELLTTAKVPIDLDVLNIDVDGQDYLVWNSLLRFYPRIVVVEYQILNFSLYTVPLLNQAGQAGCDALVKLAVSKGYMPIIGTYSNVIALRNDVPPPAIRDSYFGSMQHAPATTEQR